MNYLEFDGPGSTLVFLHGGNVAGWMWGQQVPAFTDHHVLVPDYPGFGASNDEPWISIAATADAVAELIATTGGPAHVVGLSLGSSIALELGAASAPRTQSVSCERAGRTPAATGHDCGAPITGVLESAWILDDPRAQLWTHGEGRRPVRHHRPRHQP